MIDNSSKSLEGDPITFTKINPDAIEVPRNDFKYILQDINDSMPSNCMRYVESNGKSYAVTYWNCPIADTMGQNKNGQWEVIFKCSECKMITWIEVENE